MNLVLALIGGASIAHAAELTIPHEAYELDNGLDVILAPDHSTPIVHVEIWYHVGSKDETAGLSGFAHLFEHMMFQGSVSQPGEFFAPLDAIGATVNGTTSQDRTNYFETVPAEQLPLALFLESDRMGWLLPVLTKEKLDNQREVVKNERRQNYETPPYGQARSDLNLAMYPSGHPYQSLPIGSHADLTAASVEDVKGFFARWYVPNNAALAVVGDFDSDTAKDLIDEYFGDIAPGEPIERPPVPDVVLDESIEIRQFKPVPQQRVWIAWHTPKFYAPGDASLDLLSSTLSGGTDSRLYERIVKELGLAREIQAYQASGLLQSRFVVTATAAEGHDTDEIVAAVDGILAEVLGSNPPTALEIDSAKAKFERGFYTSMQNLKGKATLLSRYNQFHGDAGWLQRDLDRYISLTSDDAVKAGKTWLTAPRVVLHIWPEVKG